MKVTIVSNNHINNNCTLLNCDIIDQKKSRKRLASSTLPTVALDSLTPQSATYDNKAQIDHITINSG